MKFSAHNLDSITATLSDFVDDAGWKEGDNVATPQLHDELIHGLRVTRLAPRVDDRGTLVELMTDRNGPLEPITHIYQVFAKPGSIRAWNYHKRQTDRQAFADGKLKVVAIDFRPKSPTYKRVNEFIFGTDYPCLLELPIFVVHGVHNLGEDQATFVSMPTRSYDPAFPDKSRLPYGHPGIPYSFTDQ